MIQYAKGALKAAMAVALSFFVAGANRCAGEAAGAGEPIRIRGGGAVYFWVEPGAFRVSLSGASRHRGQPCRVDLLLVSPDRRVIARERMEGQTGPEGVQFSCDAPFAGLYKLEMIPHEQEKGTDFIWSLTTSATRWMIEPGGLHGDREELPILLESPGRPGQIVFRNPLEPFRVDVEAKGPALRVVKDEGDILPDGEPRKILFGPKARKQTLQLDGRKPGEGEWRVLSLDAQSASLSVDTVTRWGNAREGFYLNVGYWGLSKRAAFPADALRWLIVPGCETVPLARGSETEVVVTVRNGFDEVRKIDLSLLRGASGVDVSFAEPEVSLKPGEWREIPVTLKRAREDAFVAADVVIGARVSGEEAWSNYMSLTVVNPAPARLRNVALPIRLEPYQHENALFGYRPEFTALAPDFDRHNRPVIRQAGADRDTTRGLETLDAQGWSERPFEKALREALPDYEGTMLSSGFYGNKTAFDAENGYYTLLGVRTAQCAPGEQRVVLLYSPDGGEHFQASVITSPGRYTYDIETPLGAGAGAGATGKESGPPPFLVFSRTGTPHAARWGQINTLHLYLPRLVEGRVEPGQPILVSDTALGLAAHSGGGASLISHGGKTFVTWGKVVDAAGKPPGVPIYIAAIDHASRRMSEPVLLGHAPPVNDVHNSPAMVVDSKGVFHLVMGAHGASFFYTCSSKPWEIDNGWSEPEPVLTKGEVKRGDPEGKERGAQTYVGLVCDDRDVLHLVFRQWRRKVDPDFGGSVYAALSYQRKEPGQPWSPAMPLVRPPLPNYSVFYHKLTRDRKGRLFLSYSYASIHKTYRAELPGRFHHRALLFSEDGGDHWSFATTDDLRHGITPP